VLFSNFVSSIDGVVALGSTPSAGSVISGKYPADRFLMALLRACADAVIIGAGTLRATPGHRWTPAHVFPDMAESFAVLRKKLGRQPDPRLVVVTNGGTPLDSGHPATARGATIVTTPENAASLRRTLPDSCDFIELEGQGGADLRLAVDELRARGYGVVLTEGGPHLMGGLIQQGLLDEMFLTVSPLVAGRNGEERLGMVAGVEILPSRQASSTLVSARRHGDYVFLRYASSGGFPS
jgi:riboflavin biosynthesis pyrimidine reductase